MTTITAQIISENEDALRYTIIYLKRMGIFDEVVVVADTDNGMGIKNSAMLADKYVLRSFYTPEQSIDEINDMSTSDWNFRLDDDERVGKNLYGLRDFIKLSDKDAYWFPRMWSWPVNGTFLNCYHWYPDSQVRLWKKGHLKAESGVHMHPRVIGSAGNINTHIIHDVLISRSYEERLARCKHHAELMNIPYESFIKGIGLFYLPEHIQDKLIISDYLEKAIV